jgi:hypothetical protein
MMGEDGVEAAIQAAVQVYSEALAELERENEELRERLASVLRKAETSGRSPSQEGESSLDTGENAASLALVTSADRARY